MNSSRKQILVQVIMVSLLAVLSAKTELTQAQTGVVAGFSGPGFSGEIDRRPLPLSPSLYMLEGRYFRWPNLVSLGLTRSSGYARDHYDLDLSADCHVRGKAYAQSQTISVDREGRLRESGSIVIKFGPFIKPLVYQSRCKRANQLMRALAGKLQYTVSEDRLILMNPKARIKITLYRDRLNFPFSDGTTNVLIENAN